MIGRTIGRYKIQEKLGEGGMGEVYLADDTRLDRKVALKVLPEEFAADPERLQRLEREARAAAALNNPNICTIYEIDDEADLTFISMEYIEGDSLKETIPEGGYPAEEALRICSQIAAGTAHAHSKGIIHRDLKSSNVMIDAEGQTKILDFGLAKPIERDDVQQLTQPQMTLTEAGTAVGTLPYMAPEILRGEAADKRSDIWSIGILLYEIVTGQVPFQGATGYELSSAIIKDAPPPFPGTAPAVLTDVIKRCLEKDPTARYQDATELSRILGDLQKAPISLSVVLSNLPKLVLHSRVALAGIAGIALISVLFALGRSRGEEFIPIGVWPFENTTGDTFLEVFTTGIARDLNDILHHISRFEPTETSYLLQLIQAGRRDEEIIEQQDLEYYIRGEIKGSRNYPELAVRLINREGVVVWNESIFCNLEEIDSKLKQITRTLCETINTSLSDDELTYLTGSTRGTNPEAKRAYIMGRGLLDLADVESFRSAIDYFRQSISHDSSYALAHAGLAYAYINLRIIGSFLPPSEILIAQRAALRAIELDSTSAEAYLALAMFQQNNILEWQSALSNYERAHALKRNAADINMQFGTFLELMGDIERGLQLQERAASLKENDPRINLNLGWGYYMARRYGDSIAQLRKTLQILEDFPNPGVAIYAHRELSWNYRALAHFDSAWTELNIAEELGDRAINNDRALLYACEGRHEEAIQLIPEISRDYHKARVYAALGETATALDILEGVVSERAFGCTLLRSTPAWDPLRSEPRFQALLVDLRFLF